MNCQKCNSERILQAGGKCNDMFSASIGKYEYEGYVPNDLGIGGGDYIEINICLDCGQLQKKFPLPQSEMEKDSTDSELRDFYEENFNVGEEFKNILTSRQSRIIKSAKTISLCFSIYITRLLEYYCDFDSKYVVPDFDVFIKMYRANSYILR